MLPEESQERLPFSKDQVKDLLAVAENEWRVMILLGYHTGIRLSDAANLTWANIDLLKRILVFRARKTAGRAKGGKKDSGDRDILVQFYFHLAAGELWTGRSSFAEVAAKATTARTCPSERDG